jgi:hypothetical protein
MSVKAAISDTGMVTSGISVARRSAGRRGSPARPAPTASPMVVKTFSIERSMKTALSKPISMPQHAVRQRLR